MLKFMLCLADRKTEPTQRLDRVEFDCSESPISEIQFNAGRYKVTPWGNNASFKLSAVRVVS